LCLLAGIFAAPAAAAPQVLMPGVTYEKRLTFTRFGPMRLHILTAPKPTGGLYKLQPVLSNGAVVERIAMLGTWQGLGPRRPVHLINRPPGPNGTTLYTPAYGATTPTTGGVAEAVLTPFPSTTPNTDLVGYVSENRRGGTPIPPGGGVLAARGTQAQRLLIEAAASQLVTIRLILRPEWRDVPEALGGGPILVRAGKPIFRAGEDFTTYHLNRRHPRTAIGQRADGRIVMVVVDGRRPGYSAGMTNFELAQTMIRLGVVTASALDAGGSSTMAFDGQLLSRPSDTGGERMVSEAMLVTYYGVYTPPPELSFSPNGDGLGDRQTLSYKIVRPSSVTANLVGPGGAGRTIDEGSRRPGVYRFDWTGKQSGTPEPEGRWRFQVNAVDNQGQQSTADRTFTLNNTLGFVTVNPTRAVVRRNRGGRITIGFQLTRPARVNVSITSKTGQLLRVVRNAQAPAGKVLAFWNGRYPNKRVVFSGTYVAKVTATNAVGTTELARSFSVRRR
jgi:flagellar hook assembly protein FlgD